MYVKAINGLASKGTRVLMSVMAAVCLAWTAQAVTSATVTAGNSITIGAGIANSGDYELVAEAGSTIVLPAQEDVNCWVFTRVYLTGSGTVTLVAPDAEFDAPTVVFADGLAAESDNVSLHVDVACVTGLKVGRSQNSPTALNLPVADIANVTFANANGVFGLREWATARKLPTVFETSTLVGVALYGTNPLRLGNTSNWLTSTWWRFRGTASPMVARSRFRRDGRSPSSRVECSKTRQGRRPILGSGEDSRTGRDSTASSWAARGRVSFAETTKRFGWRRTSPVSARSCSSPTPTRTSTTITVA